MWKNKSRTNLLAIVLGELIEESASLLGLEVSQHGGDDGADVFWGENEAKLRQRELQSVFLARQFVLCPADV